MLKIEILDRGSKVEETIEINQKEILENLPIVLDILDEVKKRVLIETTKTLNETIIKAIENGAPIELAYDLKSDFEQLLKNNNTSLKELGVGFSFNN